MCPSVYSFTSNYQLLRAEGSTWLLRVSTLRQWCGSRYQDCSQKQFSMVFPPKACRLSFARSSVIAVLDLTLQNLNVLGLLYLCLVLAVKINLGLGFDSHCS